MTVAAGEGPRALVVCVGNTLVADDGAGGAVHEALTTMTLPPGVSLRWLATGGMDLLDAFDGEDLLVVVDAVQFGAPPGTVHVVPWQDAREPGGAAVSAHGIGVSDVLDVAQRLFPAIAPRDAVLVGIEGRCFDRLGEGMSSAVAAAVGPAATLVASLLSDHLL